MVSYQPQAHAGDGLRSALPVRGKVFDMIVAYVIATVLAVIVGGVIGSALYKVTIGKNPVSRPAFDPDYAEYGERHLLLASL